jgi:hypothetical protein
MKTNTECQNCQKLLDDKNLVWLELNGEDGNFYFTSDENKMPEGLSQGSFAFGRDCAKKVGIKWVNK